MGIGQTVICNSFDCENNSSGKCLRKVICIDREGKCYMFHIWVRPKGEVWQGDINSNAY